MFWGRPGPDCRSRRSTNMARTLAAFPTPNKPGRSLFGHHYSVCGQGYGNRSHPPLNPDGPIEPSYFVGRGKPPLIMARFAFAQRLRESDVRVGSVNPGGTGLVGIAPRRSATILAADVVGYSRLMEADEEDTHARLMHLRFSLMEPLIALHRGRVIKNTGDGFLAMFDGATEGLAAAREMQRAVVADETEVPAQRRIAFRMGINVADVIVEDHDIYGDGVNVAARLQSLAEPGGVVISEMVADQAGGALGMQSVDLGQLHMRNRER